MSDPVDTTADGQIVLASKQKFNLSDMIAQCDLKAAPPADLAIWDVVRPVGQENVDIVSASHAELF